MGDAEGRGPCIPKAEGPICAIKKDFAIFLCSDVECFRGIYLSRRP